MVAQATGPHCLHLLQCARVVAALLSLSLFWVSAKSRGATCARHIKGPWAFNLLCQEPNPAAIIKEVYFCRVRFLKGCLDPQDVATPALPMLHWLSAISAAVRFQKHKGKAHTHKRLCAANAPTGFELGLSAPETCRSPTLPLPKKAP